MVGGKPRDVQVPDVRGQVSADAIAALQNKGFKIRTQQKPDTTVPPDHVISTDPAGNTSVGAGDEITDQRLDRSRAARGARRVAALSYADAVKKLTAAGFGKFKQTDVGVDAGAEGQGAEHQSAGQPDLGDHQRDHHRRRHRPGRQRRCPTSPARPSTSASRSSTRSASPRPLPVAGRQHRAGRSGDRHRSRRPGRPSRWTPSIQLQVSRGNQFVMPDLHGSVLDRRRTATCGRWAGPAS